MSWQNGEAACSARHTWRAKHMTESDFRGPAITTRMIVAPEHCPTCLRPWKSVTPLPEG
jgi:hypothetical protein